MATKPRTLGSSRRSLLASSAGNWLEWFEWSTYAVLAPFISKAMFNPANPASATLATFGVFAVGFLMRPLGGIFFGRVADKRGRKFVLIITMLVMSAGSFAIALVPTYAVIGVGASLFLLAIRMIQGFAHGGESATAYAYAAEIAPPDRRGQWGSMVFMAIFGGSVLAYSVGGTMTATLGTGAVGDWAWRIPFAIGGVLCLVVLYLRRNMEETESFEESQQPSTATDSSGASGLVQPSAGPQAGTVRPIVLIVLLVSGLTAAHYTWTSYVSTYAIVQKGMAPTSAYWTTVLVQGVMLVVMPFLGRISDLVGRRPVYITAGLLMAVTQFPMMSLISNVPWTLGVASGVALLVVCLAGSSLAAYMSEQFATHKRSLGIGIAYSLAVALFGGTAPYINQFFNNIDLGWAPSAYIVGLCIVSTIAAWLLPETRGTDLTGAKPQEEPVKQN